MDDRDFSSMVGRRFPFHGIDNNTFCLTVQGTRRAYEAVEDESDGYRSMMDELRPVPLKGRIFFREPIATVRVEEDNEGEFSGYRLVDVRNGHVWLRFGTDHHDDYYPMFTFEYTPREFSRRTAQERR